jgi:glutamate synthase domain-containing protein 3
VAIQRVITPAGEAQLKGLIQQQAAKTGSKKAAALLADWANAKGKFWQIVPPGECVGRIVGLQTAAACGRIGLVTFSVMTHHGLQDTVSIVLVRKAGVLLWRVRPCKFQNIPDFSLLFALIVACAAAAEKNSPQANPAVADTAVTEPAAASAPVQVAATA